MTPLPFQGTTLAALLRERAFAQPDARAFVFLRDGDIEEAAWTYADLDARSRAVAARLQAKRIRPGARALLVYPPGLDFIAAFFGCLYAGVIAVPVQAPTGGRSARGADRMRAVADDAEPAIVLTSADLAERCRVALSARAAILPTDDVAVDGGGGGGGGDRYIAIPIEGESVAFLQYTSGSTAAPRGVIVTHANLVSNLGAAFRLATPGETRASVSWLPVTHDMGLIEGVLQPLYRGHTAVLMAPTAFLQRPARWLTAIARYRAGRSGAPNFAYDLCVRRVPAAVATAIDLSCWRDAYNGAEPVRAETLAAFADAFRASGFDARALRPCYGLAEATLVVASGRWRADARTSVSCDALAHDTRVIIVHPETRRRCAEAEIGEVWIAGPGVAKGYWRQPALTETTFRARTPEGDGPFLRTGDLGCVRRGALEITGRLKDVLIVRGGKHFPQDLEHTAEASHPLIRPAACAAFAIGEDRAGDRIAVVVEIDPRRADPASHDAVIAAVRAAIVADCGVQVHGIAIVSPGGVPRTPSGKVQRFRCRAWWMSGRTAALTSWTADAPAITDPLAVPA